MRNSKVINWEDEFEIWDFIHPFNRKYFDENFDKIALRLLEFLLTTLFSRDEIEIGLIHQRKGRKLIIKPIVTYNQFETDRQLNFILDENGNFEIEVFLYDNFDDVNPEKSYRRRLDQKEVKMVPEGLINLMIEAQKKDEGCVIGSNSLRKTN